MTRRVAWAALWVACAAVGSVGCRQPPASPDLITIAVATSPNNLDPRVGTDDVSQRLSQLVYNNLLNLDDQLRVVPGLAASWETPDDRTYVVHLRHGVLFHDGHELTADDVVYTFESLLDPKFVSPRKGAYRAVETVSARDPYTVAFRLREPFGSFLVNLVMPIVPNRAGPGLRGHPVGTGPYQFVAYVPDDRVELAAFRGYFDGPPRNAGVVIRIVPDDVMRGLELRKGSVDLVVNDLAPDIVYQLERDPRLRTLESAGTDYAYLGFNLRDPIFRDVRVRQAISFAVNRDAIVKYLRRGLAAPAVGILPPISWAFNPAVFTFSYDPPRAARLLDEAGYRDPDGPQPRLRFTLKVSTAEFSRLQAAVVQQDLRRIGVEIDIRSYEFATLYADVLRGNFQMFSLQWVGVSDPDMLRRVFHSHQMPPAGFNRGYYSDATVDRLIDAATVSTNDADRRRLYGEVQRIVAEAAPYVSLWYKTNVAVFQRNLEGVRLTPAGDFTFLKNVRRASDARALTRQ